MKKALPWIIAGALALGLLALIDHSCGGPDAKYWVKRSVYDRDVKDRDVKLGAALVVVAEQNLVISAKTAEIATILANAPKPTPSEKVKDAEIADLQAQLEAFKSWGDIAGALATAELEITAWAEKFTLAERRHQDSLSALNNAWQVKFNAQVVISQEGWAAYEREHALRLTCDSLRLDLEKHARGGKFWGYVGKGSAAYFAVKGGIKLAQAIFTK